MEAAYIRSRIKHAECKRSHTNTDSLKRACFHLNRRIMGRRFATHRLDNISPDRWCFLQRGHIWRLSVAARQKQTFRPQESAGILRNPQGSRDPRGSSEILEKAERDLQESSENLRDSRGNHEAAAKKESSGILRNLQES